MARFLQLSRQLEECFSRSGKHMYLLRHGESMGNSAGSIVGWTDTKLSVKGRNQSHELFKGLHKHVDKFTSIHSSDMSRCTDTLNFALGFSSRKVITHKDLRELNFGDDEGRHFDSLPEAQKAIINSFNYKPPNGETWPDAKTRVQKYLVSLPQGHHLVSTHGGVICAMLYHLGMQDVIPNCSIVSAEFDDSSKLFRAVNFYWQFQEEDQQ